MCDMIFSGVFERHPRLTLAIVEFELAWTASATARRSTGSKGPALAKAGDGMRPSDFFRRNFQSWLDDTRAYAWTPTALAALSRRRHQARSFRL